MHLLHEMRGVCRKAGNGFKPAQAAASRPRALANPLEDGDFEHVVTKREPAMSNLKASDCCTGAAFLLATRAVR